ncbi:MAG: DUF3108 domain-containing protein [Candidatus Thiodiazotropha sp.]
MRSADSPADCVWRGSRITVQALGILLGLCLLTLRIEPARAAAPLLKPFSATYRVHRNIIPLGSLTLSLELGDDSRYIYRAHTYPGFLAGIFSRNEVLEESRGQLLAERVEPDMYRYRDQDVSEENTELSFDWGRLTVDTHSRGVTWSQEILPGTQDKLSQQLQVRRHLAEGRTHLIYQVADGGKLKTYEFMVDGDETLETPYGSLRCLRVRRSKESAPADYTIWFAPELDYFPVRIERKQGDRVYRMELKSLSLSGD